MKKLVIVVAILMFPISAMCAPFLVCDPQANVTSYQVLGDGFFTNPVEAQADGSIKADVGGITSGTHSITVSACNVWGCSSTVPFVFTKAVPTLPSSLKITP